MSFTMALRQGAVYLFPSCLALFGACTYQAPSDSTSLDPLTFTLADLGIVGTSERIAGIVDVMPMEDGSAWVLNDTEPFLFLLSAEGDILRAEGRRGGGPGEFSWPTTFVRDPSTGAVWVYDVTQRHLVRVEEATAELEVLPLPRDSSGIPRMSSYEYLWMSNGGRVWIRGTPDGFIFARASSAVPWIFSLWSTEVVRLSGDGSLDEVASTEDIVGDPAARFPGARRFLPYPIWSACPDGSLAVYNPNENTIRRLTAEGDSLASQELPPERQVEITSERIFETVYPGVLRNRAWGTPPERDELRQLVRRDYETREDEFSEVFPEYADLDCADGNTLWIQPFDTTSGEMGRGPRWLRITEAGAMGTVHFPPSFRPMRFHEGRIWGVQRDEYDVEHLAWADASSL